MSQFSNQMESLYTKLHDKYNKLKSEKDYGMEQINRDQESKFIAYVSAAEELIEKLVNDSENLRAKNVELLNELSLARSNMDELLAVNQRLLMEEVQRRRSDECSMAIEKIRHTRHEDNSVPIRDRIDGDITPNSKILSPGVTYDSSGHAVSRKQSRLGKRQRKESLSDDSYVAKKRKDADMEVVSTDDVHRSAQHCATMIKDAEGDESCMFRALVECLTGMKVSAAEEGAGSTILVIHQSSGYAFSLRWAAVGKGGGDEGELMYKVVSLGTFERVAPNWMRDVLSFGFSMCPLFFQRVSHVIRLHE